MTDSVHTRSLKKAYRAPGWTLTIALACSVFLITVTSISAQSSNQLPAPKSYVSDFAGIVDSETKSRLETVLQNLKDKTKVEFYVATVDTTEGLDIFDFSRQLAVAWNIGARNTANKSLLLVISVASKTSFTQFSRLMQVDLPDGVLGDMTQRMRTPLSAGRFSEALNEGVQLFISSLAQRSGFSAQDLEPTTSPAPAKIAETQTEAVPQPVSSPASEAAQTRPRTVSEKQPETSSPTPAETEPKQNETVLKTSAPEAKPTPIDAVTESARTETKPEPKVPVAEPSRTEATPAPKEPATAEPARIETKPAKTTAASKKNAQPVDDDAEAEEVELTLTLPLSKRAEKLKAFLETHPDSKARPRATELLISTHAGLGDQYLKNGDTDKGTKHLMLAIEESDVNISDKLFAGVISQIPSNLYLRGQAEASFKAASDIETKFGSDPKRLLSLAAFYAGIERGDEAARIAELAVKLAPDLPEAHRVLALGRHMNLQLEEAAAEYKKTVELDPTSRISKSSLADLTRGSGKTEEALELYNDLLKTDPNDRAARAGVVLCLLELGRKDEATSALDTALTAEPRNLALLSGVAYWFAAHGDYEKAFDFARNAIAIEPRYTWAQIALVRSLIGLKRPVGAERAMRYARQFGKFPTLTYELANVVATMGFYDEAAEILRESFTFKDGQIETLLAGRIPARNNNFLDLLAPERRASIYQPTAADSAANSKMLKNLLALDTALTETSSGQQLDEKVASDAANEFGSGSDGMRTFRQLYAASRLLRKMVALPTALELVTAARQGSEAALNVPVATTAVQAEEFRDLRAQAIATGTIPDVADAGRSVLSNIMLGRIEDLTGWILFNQDKYPEAIVHLKRAITILPDGTPSWRNAQWHLGVAYEQTGKNDAALESYIQSYNTGERDPIRRAVIEKVYRKVNGSLEGLDDKIGRGELSSGASQAPATASSQEPAATTPSPEPTTPTTPTMPTSPASQATPEKTAPTETAPAEVAKPEATPVATPEPTPTATPTATPTPTPTTSESPVPPPSGSLSEEALKAAGARLRSSIKITGKVLDASNNPLSDVVVVLISPSGSVLASTTNKEGSFSFTVAPSQKTYRVIPSKDGYTFSPVDKAFVGLIDDQTGIDFVGTTGRSP